MLCKDLKLLIGTFSFKLLFSPLRFNIEELRNDYSKTKRAKVKGFRIVI